MEIAKFNPTVAELTTLAEKAKAVDTKDLVAVKEMRLELRTARTTVTKTGKEFRAEALAFQKAVIAKEKELLELITPEEDRLKAVEEEVAKAAEVEERKKILPWRKEELAKVEQVIADEILLTWDDATFKEHLNAAKAEKLDREEAKKREEELVAQREKEKEEAAAKAVEEERERAAKEAKEKEEREARELEEAKQREAEEQAKAEKNKKYKDFLKKNDYNETDFKVVREGETFKLYKLVDTITIS